MHQNLETSQSWPLLISPQSHRLYLRTSRVTAECHVEKQHARQSIITQERNRGENQYKRSKGRLWKERPNYSEHLSEHFLCAGDAAKWFSFI